MERTQFTFFASFAKAAERIRKKTDRCEFYDVVKDYALYGKEPDLDGLPDSVAVAFELVRPNIDASRRKAESGKNGGKRKQTESKSEANRKQTEAKRKQGKAASKKESEKEKEKEGENEREKESECSPPIVPPNGLVSLSPALQSAVEDWLQYKTEKREPYKPQGLKSLVTEVKNNADRYGDAAVIELIRQCMSNNWRGIIFDRLKKQPSAERGGNVFLDMLHERGGAHDG